jgi:hypothetical protein
VLKAAIIAEKKNSYPTNGDFDIFSPVLIVFIAL